MASPPAHPLAASHPASLAYNTSQLEAARQCLTWGWGLVGGGCVIALIPFLGFVAWFIASPLILTGLVLSIVGMVKGRTVGGILLMLFSLFVAPVFLFFGPVVSGLMGLAATSS